MRATVTAFAMLLLCCRGGGGAGHPARDLAPQVLENFAALASAGEFLSTTSVALGDDARLEATRAWLLQRADVAGATHAPGEAAVVVHFRNGLDGLVLLEPPEQLAPVPLAARAADALPAPQARPAAALPAPADAPTRVLFGHGRDVPTNLAGYVAGLDTRFEELGFGLGDSSARVTVEEEEFTTAFLRTGLAGHQVIHLFAHGWSVGTVSYVGAGKLAAQGGAYPAPSAEDQEDLKPTDGSAPRLVQAVQVNPSAVVPRYLFNAEFIRRHYGATHPLARNALVHVNACRQHADLAEAFIASGAAAVAYYDDIYTYNYQNAQPATELELYGLVRDGRTLGEAHAAMIEAYPTLALRVVPAEVAARLRIARLDRVDFRFGACLPSDEPVEFLGTAVAPAGATVNEWRWDFGDGNALAESDFELASPSATMFHRYLDPPPDPALPGYSEPFQVAVHARDLLGHVATATHEVRLKLAPGGAGSLTSDVCAAQDPCDVAGEWSFHCPAGPVCGDDLFPETTGPFAISAATATNGGAVDGFYPGVSDARLVRFDPATCTMTVVVPPPPEPTPCDLPASADVRLFAGSGTGGLPYAEWGTASGGTEEVCWCAGLRTCTFAR